MWIEKFWIFWTIKFPSNENLASNFYLIAFACVHFQKETFESWSFILQVMWCPRHLQSSWAWTNTKVCISQIEILDVSHSEISSDSNMILDEDLIKWGWPEDVWFHVDNLSSAHVYLRLQPVSEDILFFSFIFGSIWRFIYFARFVGSNYRWHSVGCYWRCNAISKSQ